MKSLPRSKILLASLAVNLALGTVVLVRFLGSDAAPPAVPTFPATLGTAPAHFVSLPPAPVARPVSPPTFTPLSAPPTPATPATPASWPASTSVAISSLPVQSRQTEKTSPAEFLSNSSSRAAAPAATDTASLGPASPVNASAPGNFFVSRGVRVAVAETYPPAEGGDVPLGVDLTPAASAGQPDAENESSPAPTAATTSDDNGKNTADTTTTNPATSANATNPSPGSTTNRSPTDEELFRMKWGWAAFDAAQTEALREAGRTRTR